MTMQAILKKSRSKVLLGAAAAAMACGFGEYAHAQITRGFIAPHEYALPEPTTMKPWNVFVQYATWQDTKKVWNSNGDKVSVGNTEVLVGLSKYVHFWAPEAFGRKLGVGWEIIVPEVGIRDRTTRASSSGLGDPITGPAIWIKPAPNWTLGADLFAQIPVGDSDVGGGQNWNIIGSVFWDGQFGKLNYTGNLGYNVPGVGSQDTIWYTNHRLGFMVSDLIEPYIGIDYEWQDGSSSNLENHEVAGAIGVMFHVFKHSSIAVHYERGFDGENRPLSNNANLRWVYVF